MVKIISKKAYKLTLNDARLHIANNAICMNELEISIFSQFENSSEILTLSIPKIKYMEFKNCWFKLVHSGWSPTKPGVPTSNREVKNRSVPSAFLFEEFNPPPKGRAKGGTSLVITGSSVGGFRNVIQLSEIHSLEVCMSKNSDSNVRFSFTCDGINIYEGDQS